MKSLKLLVIVLLSEIIGVLSALTLKRSTGYSEPEKNTNIAFYLFFYVIILAIIIYLLIRIKKLKVLEVIFSIFTFFLVSYYLVLISYTDLAIIPAILLCIFSYKNRIVKFVTSWIAMISAGVFLGITLHISVLVIFLVLLAIYDFISVYKTKHMVVFAENLKEQPILLKGKDFMIGGGDIAIPTAFITASYWSNLSLKYPACILVATAITFLFFILLSEKGKYYPALPPLVVGSFIGYLIAMVI